MAAKYKLQRQLMRMIIFLLLSIVTIELHAMASRMHARDQYIFITNNASDRIIIGVQGQGALHLSFFIDAGNNTPLVVRSNPPYELNFTPLYNLNTFVAYPIENKFYLMNLIISKNKEGKLIVHEYESDNPVTD